VAHDDSIEIDLGFVTDMAAMAAAIYLHKIRLSVIVPPAVAKMIAYSNNLNAAKQGRV
jgi:hypothetical protein